MPSATDVYQQLFDANPLPMFVADRESAQILMVNRAACDHYGWSRDELLAMTLRDIRPAEELPNFEQVYAATKDATYSRLGRHRTKDGRIIDVTLQISGVVIDGRQASLAVITDVTGIAQAERRFRLLVEHSSDGIAVTTETGSVEYISPGGAQMIGYTTGELVGTQARMVTHPDDAAQWKAPLPGETARRIGRNAHRDGSWRWIESTTTNLTHDPAVRAFVSNFRDITEQRLAALSVQRSEANFRALIEHAPFVTLVQREGRYVYVNPAAVAMLGVAGATDVVGKPILDFVHPDDRDAIRQRVDHVHRHGSTTPTVVRLLRADGSVVALEAQGLIIDFDGHPAVLVMGQDVTERHEMFTRMAVADRMLSIGTLAAGVAHEINNPLAYVVTNLAMISGELRHRQPTRRSRLTESALAGLVADTQEGVARVTEIVRELRSLSRHDEEVRGPVDVIAVLGSAIKMAHHEMRHRARVIQVYAAEVPAVDADPTRLGQVFLNLLLNAAQAIADGHVEDNEIRIRAMPIDGGARVQVDVEDSGAGIPESIIRRIFDPFFTTKAPGLGTGLGLSISHQIVRSLGGELVVESTPGQGSTFSVRLQASTAQPSASAPADASPRSVTARILLIDDEEMIGRSMTVLLAPETEVVAVSRARDALARLEAGEQFDAIVCDLMMPEISGIELYDQLVRRAPACTSRIIFMTGGAFTPQAREFLARVDRPHLEKPFSEAQLRRALEQVAR